MLDITFEYLVLNFIKNVNRKLKGHDLDELPNNDVEKQASEIYKKKKNIGKYVPKVDLSDRNSTDVIKNGAKEKPANDVINKAVMKKTVKVIDVTKKHLIKKRAITKPLLKQNAINKAVIKDLVIKPLVIKNRRVSSRVRRPVVVFDI